MHINSDKKPTLNLWFALDWLSQQGDFTIMYFDGKGKYPKGWICKQGYFIVETEMIKTTLEEAISNVMTYILENDTVQIPE